MRRDGHFDQRLLAFVTLGLVAFGLVMVYSATSASAALGDGDPMSYLKRQAVYALIGVIADDGGRPLRLPPPPLPRAAAAPRRARPLRRRARPRARDQRRATLVPARPCELPAVRAREARPLPLRRRVPRAAPPAADVRRALQAPGTAHRDLLRADPARARPRNDDLSLRDDARRLPRRGRAGAASRGRVACSRRPWGCSRSGSSRTAARGSSASSTRGATRRARASRSSRR